jgi:hypothetical protein
MESEPIKNELIQERLKGLRFAGELISFAQIKKNKKLQRISSNYIGENPNLSIENDYLKNNFVITDDLAPKYFKLFKTVAGNLGYPITNISPFIISSSVINAACIKVTDYKHLIYLTSSLIEKMNDDEIMYVIGHEIGHAIFDHHQLPIHGIMHHEYKLKPNEILDVLRWSRMAEISADRVGLIGCGSLEAALGAKLVLSSGMPSSNFDLAIDKYQKQTSDLINYLIANDSFEDLYSTHSFNPLRVNALCQFNECHELFESFGIGLNKRSLAEVSIEIRSIFSSMEGDDLPLDKKLVDKTQDSTKEKLSKKEVTLSDEESLLFWGSVCVATKDSKLTNDEIDTIMSLLDSDEALVAINRLKLNKKPFEEANKQLNNQIDNYRKLSQPTKCGILQKLILVARADSKVTDEEKQILKSICEQINIPATFYEKILNYL